MQDPPEVETETSYLSPNLNIWVQCYAAFREKKEESKCRKRWCRNQEIITIFVNCNADREGFVCESVGGGVV